MPRIYHLDLSEFILPYDTVRTSSAPDQMILDFFQSTYEVGATLGGWDRAALERPNPLPHRERTTSDDPLYPPRPDP